MDPKKGPWRKHTKNMEVPEIFFGVLKNIYIYICVCVFFQHVCVGCLLWRNQHKTQKNVVVFGRNMWFAREKNAKLYHYSDWRKILEETHQFFASCGENLRKKTFNKHILNFTNIEKLFLYSPWVKFCWGKFGHKM